MATVAEEAMELENYEYSEIVGFFLVKKLMQMINAIKYNLEVKNNIYKLDIWSKYIQQKDFKDILDYIVKGIKHNINFYSHNTHYRYELAFTVHRRQTEALHEACYTNTYT